MKKFVGKVAIVARAASGIGRARALRLAERGYQHLLPIPKRQEEARLFFRRRVASPETFALAIISVSEKNAPRVRPESLFGEWMKRTFPVTVRRWIDWRWEKDSASPIASSQATG